MFPHLRSGRLLDAYLDGALPEAERAKLTLHLRRCPRCAREARLTRRIKAALAGMPARFPASVTGVRLRHYASRLASQPRR